MYLLKPFATVFGIAMIGVWCYSLMGTVVLQDASHDCESSILALADAPVINDRTSAKMTATCVGAAAKARVLVAPFVK
ncbi:hypothetical protein SAMN04515620_1674 [Collimonas sp. OK607]|uniref:hypothetical protein n=1 Tax=Collimonas sp. OK607 TaxID=1798194 RepID=UPI0008E0F84D|nr:hypothetical protein [Collimonas sp. OK607]SFB40134.1 hypothetical protein SAMN04515620_1674 [Collimonas sp. OK607]